MGSRESAIEEGTAKVSASPPRPPHVVVVGFGPVACRLVEELLPAVRSGRLAVTVVGDEAHPAYNRVLVADLGVGRTTVEALTLADVAELEAAGVVLHLGRCVRRVDRARALVHLSDGADLHYDRLVFATGARPVVPNLRGLNPDPLAPLQLPAGVTTLRDLNDAATLHRAVRSRRRVVVLGGGILGLEVALAASEEGARVTVVHHGPHPLGRSIDADAGLVLTAVLRGRGITVASRARSTGVVLEAAPAPGGDGAAPEASFSALELDDGGTVPGDLLVISCGVRPRTEVAAGSGLRTGRGILVDHGLRAHGDPRVFAIGDCAEVRCPDAGCPECTAGAGPLGLIGPGWRQAEWLARFLLRPGELAPPLPGERAPAMLLKARGVDVAAAGDVAAGPFDGPAPVPAPWGTPHGPAGTIPGHPAPLRVSVWSDPEHGQYVKMATRDGVLEGFVSVGMPRAGAELVLLYERGAELPADRSALLGLDSPRPPASGGASRTVCRCAGVDRQTIAAAVAEGCTTVGQVSAATRAGTGCGGCHGELQGMIEAHFAPV